MKTKYTILGDKTTLIAERSFPATPSKVWEAWTNSDLLDKWWGPLPYKAVTHSFEFAEGGAWKYFMEGPEGDRHYCQNTYLTIDPEKQFTARDSFCNEDWSINESLPTADWLVEFTGNEEVTNIKVTTKYKTEEELAKVSEMGMKEGFDMGLNQLEELLVMSN